MKLLHDNVLVTPEVKEETTESGIILGSAPKAQSIGRVFASGDGKFESGKWIHNEVQEGDIVQFGPYSEPIVIEGNKYLLMKHSNIICIL